MTGRSLGPAPPRHFSAKARNSPSADYFLWCFVRPKSNDHHSKYPRWPPSLSDRSWIRWHSSDRSTTVFVLFLSEHHPRSDTLSHTAHQHPDSQYHSCCQNFLRPAIIRTKQTIVALNSQPFKHLHLGMPCSDSTNLEEYLRAFPLLARTLVRYIN